MSLYTPTQIATTAPSRHRMDIEKTVRAFQGEVDREESFRSIFSHCYPALQGYFINKGVPREESHDLAQTTLLHVHESLGEFRFECPFMAWVFTIARNNFGKWVKRRERDRNLHGRDGGLEELLKAGKEPEAPEPSPEKRALSSSLASQVRQAVAELPPQQKACIRLYYLQGRSYSEIAAILDIAIGTVGAHINFAKEQLKKLLRASIQTDDGPGVGDDN